MKIFTRAGLAGMVAMFAAGVTVNAEDAAAPPSLSMISEIHVDPAQEEQFDAAWKTIRDTAAENDYPYPTYAMKSRNKRWLITPMSNFADVDAVMAARKAVSDAGGKNFSKAEKTFNSAMMSVHTFFTRRDVDLSYRMDTMEGKSYIEVDTFYYKPGTKAEVKSLLAEYKEVMVEVDSPHGYEINWDGPGTKGPSFTIVTAVESPLALAERDAAMNKIFESNDKMASIFERFLKVGAGSETMTAWFDAEASMLPDMPEESASE